MQSNRSTLILIILYTHDSSASGVDHLPLKTLAIMPSLELALYALVKYSSQLNDLQLLHGNHSEHAVVPLWIRILGSNESSLTLVVSDYYDCQELVGLSWKAELPVMNYAGGSPLLTDKEEGGYHGAANLEEAVEKAVTTAWSPEVAGVRGWRSYRSLASPELFGAVLHANQIKAQQIQIPFSFLSSMASLLILPQNLSSINVDTRPSANFPPTTWGDYFLSNTMEMEDNKVENKVEELKREVRKLLITCVDDKPSQQLSLIDSIQRLGVAYHFETEINELLDHLYKKYNEIGEKSDKDLQVVALWFRLVRQRGFSISCDTLNKFTDENRNFNESFANDAQGLLSLYEASQMRMHGEDILERGFGFSTTSLKAAIASHVEDGFATQVRHALKWPLMKAIPRFGIRHYISFYETDPLHHPVLLSFAKLDFGVLQRLYNKELREISRWWKDLKLVEKLSFARDRCVECYIWAMAICFEPKYSLARIITSKIIMMQSILDDIYDAYGTFEELQLFTRAIERWNVKCIDELPDYMKVYYEALMDIYRGIEQDISKDHIPDAIHYAKEAMKKQARYLFTEAKWYHDGYIPTIEEYLRVARVTCYHLIPPTSLIGMGDAATKEAFEWIASDPKLLIASGVIGRIMNDITSHKFEQERGHVASAIECYMTQYGVTEKEAVEELEQQITDAWKDIIEDYVQSPHVPNTILTRVINVARVLDLFYKDQDGFTFSNGEIKLFITSLLIDRMPI
ncbi:(-)-germacrene D synthase-like [Momordica charantia]|uniref:(-)-germacrene D synthase-like n=1 Tax=Momordica charantia TaxID=3673 RepID=A0A6J1CQG9_MOMCH|nr:(-)-germacrene D synthase-like [Momordica charantia]